MTSQLLLKNGTVLQHDTDDNVIVLRNTDILIKGSRIVQIGNQLHVAESVSTIDCSNKIISPGFVDTHHHLWQTQLKGRFGDQTLLDYIVDGKRVRSWHQPVTDPSRQSPKSEFHATRYVLGSTGGLSRSS